jgi:hypothetical protein
MKADERKDEWLEAGLAELKRQEATVETPRRIEAALMATWDAEMGGTHVIPAGIHATARWKRTSLTRVASLAAGVLLAVTLGRLGHTLREPALRPAAAETAALLLMGEPILDGELLRVIPMEMPAAALFRLGMRTSSVDPSAHITVDVLVGEDGVARAIRF